MVNKDFGECSAVLSKIEALRLRCWKNKVVFRISLATREDEDLAVFLMVGETGKRMCSLLHAIQGSIQRGAL